MDSPAIKALPNVDVEAPSSTPGGLAASLEPASDGALVVEPGKTKRCTICRKLLPISEFGKNKLGKEGLQAYCRPCNNLQHRQYRKDHPEKEREVYLRRRQKNLEKFLYNKKEFAIKWRYGITMDEYNKMIEKSENRCAICNKEFTKDNHVHIDHDHSKNKGDNGFIRGLLCGKCNIGLGQFYDDPENLIKAAAYLRNARSEQADVLDRQSPPSLLGNREAPTMGELGAVLHQNFDAIKDSPDGDGRVEVNG